MRVLEGSQLVKRLESVDGEVLRLSLSDRLRMTSLLIFSVEFRRTKTCWTFWGI